MTPSQPVVGTQQWRKLHRQALSSCDTFGVRGQGDPFGNQGSERVEDSPVNALRKQMMSLPPIFAVHSDGADGTTR